MIRCGDIVINLMLKVTLFQIPKGVTAKGIDCTLDCTNESNESHLSYSGTYSAKSHGHSPKLCKCLAAAGSSVRQREVCSYLTVYKAEGVYRERLRLPFSPWLPDGKIGSLPFLGLRQGGGRGGAIQGKEGIQFCSVA